MRALQGWMEKICSTLYRWIAGTSSGIEIPRHPFGEYVNLPLQKSYYIRCLRWSCHIRYRNLLVALLTCQGLVVRLDWGSVCVGFSPDERRHCRGFSPQMGESLPKLIDHTADNLIRESLYQPYNLWGCELPPRQRSS
ncbi:hypothetical protein LIER_40963 [Lithospermum erythrorhizon]|uniref:Uncharacterized protein n=1 Tax=Lithospermum erythrorhizon TaxID=34254 RepID=A0AAV3R644_LITER